MHHCNDGKFYLWLWPFEYFYQQLDGRDGFIKLANGILTGGTVLRLDDKIRISPAPERWEWWVEIKYIEEKQQGVWPYGEIVQTVVQITTSRLAIATAYNGEEHNDFSVILDLFIVVSF